MAPRPWDARLARLLVRPLVGTRVHPNHLTTLGLLLGLGAAWLFAHDDPAIRNAAALLYVVTTVVDHADGELARLAGKASAFGHRYDRAVDLVVKTAVFVGMGVGLRHGPAGAWTIVAGVTAGLAFLTIFGLRSGIAERQGTAALAQPGVAGFELEDILYVVAPVTWLGWLGPFLLAAGIGAPLFALRVLRQYPRGRRGAPPPP